MRALSKWGSMHLRDRLYHAKLSLSLKSSKPFCQINDQLMRYTGVLTAKGPKSDHVLKITQAALGRYLLQVH